MGSETYLVLLENDRELRRVPQPESDLKRGLITIPPTEDASTVTHMRMDYADGHSSPELEPNDFLVWLLSGSLGLKH